MCLCQAGTFSAASVRPAGVAALLLFLNVYIDYSKMLLFGCDRFLPGNVSGGVGSRTDLKTAAGEGSVPIPHALLSFSSVSHTDCGQ